MGEDLDRVLWALAGMVAQYLGDPPYHQFMNAGEDACEVLADHGLMVETPSGGEWTTKGRALLEKDY